MTELERLTEIVRKRDPNVLATIERLYSDETNRLAALRDAAQMWGLWPRPADRIQRRAKRR
jgi:hypothetical protein